MHFFFYSILFIITYFFLFTSKQLQNGACFFHEGGESTLRLAQRIYNLLDDIRKESKEKTYILVAHNGIARVVQSYFTDMTNEEYAAWGVKNCAVVRYDF